ncbi:DUF445 domain-containing protein [Pseudoalteromonas mariniglutinosa]|uniref:DUF445 domain-containing protein n=1 Tax=Pseudoalteromonas mariniglutinosa TaxID=206042 RepID=UPI00384A5043
MNKSLTTNLLAVVLVVLGLLFDQAIILSVGLFALSGAMTNWLAVHMLFEKIPFLYGSGVIALKFVSFKVAIRELVMTEFFSEQKISQVMALSKPKIDLAPVIADVDLNPAFDSLVEVIEKSQFAGMLAMFGGSDALEPMRAAFIEKMRVAIIDISQSAQFNHILDEKLFASESATGSLFATITTLVDERLDELTPTMVKEIIQTMIREHLGWLVIWGGVFGGLFGLLAALI